MSAGKSFADSMQELIRARRAELMLEEQRVRQEIARVTNELKELQKYCSHPSGVHYEVAGSAAMYCADCGTDVVYVDTVQHARTDMRGRPRMESPLVHSD